MATSIKNKYSKEERTQLIIDSSKNKNSSLNKISDYISKPNVKAFNSILVDKAFRCNNNMGRPLALTSREDCENEVVGYFKLCYDYDMIPTISSLALYLGISRDKLYNTINTQTSDFYDILRKAVDTCQAYQELPALDGTLSAPTWIFTAKNYFGMRDTQQIQVSAQQNTNNPTNTISAIKEQLLLENDNNDNHN